MDDVIEFHGKIKKKDNRTPHSKMTAKEAGTKTYAEIYQRDPRKSFFVTQKYVPQPHRTLADLEDDLEFSKYATQK